MNELDFITKVHTGTKRNYVQRVVEHDKAACAEIAVKFGKDYWDGDRSVGYGGYRYDGRWRPVAEKMVAHYGIKAGDKILDVGCGKAHLLYEFTQIVPGVQISGLDISEYGILDAKPEVKEFLQVGHCKSLPYKDNEFDFVVSLNTLHNLYNYDLHSAVKEIERVGKKNKYIVVESYRNESEKVNLMYWQLTCRAFYKPEEWAWAYKQAGYTGDYGFIFFE